MAKFNTLCPACNAEIHVYSEWAGKRATCPICQKTISVPYPTALTSEVPVRYQAFCPRCGASQAVPADQSKEFHRNCDQCGTPYLYSPGLAFRCAEMLPPGADGQQRISCPFCNRHYTLKYIPVNNLIGCQDCMNIFAAPFTGTALPKVPPLPEIVGTPKPELLQNVIRFNPVSENTHTPEPALPPLPLADPHAETVCFTPLDKLEPANRPPVSQPVIPVPDVKPKALPDTLVLNTSATPPVLKPLPTPSQELNPQLLFEKEFSRKDRKEVVKLSPHFFTDSGSDAPETDPPPQTPEDPNSFDQKLKRLLSNRFDAATAETLFAVLQMAANIIWMLLGGLVGALLLVLNGILMCLTVILIPFGLQMFKLAGLVLCPFGADVYRKQADEKVGCLSTGLNILWLFFGGGLLMAFVYFLLAVIFFLTIIGTPIALQCVKIGKLVLTPFGLEVRHTPGIKRLYVAAGIILLLVLIFI